MMIYEPYDDPKYHSYIGLTKSEAEFRKSLIKNVDYTISIAIIKGIFT